MSNYIKGQTEVMVKEESKFGFKDMDGNYWNMSGKVNKADFKPGTRYIVDWYQKEGSKNKYVNSGKPVTTVAVADKPASKAVEAKPVEAKPSIKATVNASASRDASIERQAVLKSVLESPVLAKLSDSVEDVEVLGTRLFNHFFKVLKGE